MVVDVFEPEPFVRAPEAEEEVEYCVAEVRWRIPGGPGTPSRPCAGWTEVIRRLARDRDTHRPE